MVTCTGHIGIHEGADVNVMATKPNFLIDGLPYFLNYGAPRTRGAPLINEG